MTDKNIKPILEALLFATNDPLTPKKLADLIKGADAKDVRQALIELKENYDEQGRGFTIQEVASGFQILSREDYGDYIRELHRTYAQARLSQAALETLAIIAYKQPTLRAEIEAIRGVGAGPLLRTLIDRGLVKFVGRADTLGRPALYGTTKKFLERFNLKSLKELPQPEIDDARDAKATTDDSEPESVEAPADLVDALQSTEEEHPAEPVESESLDESPVVVDMDEVVKSAMDEAEPTDSTETGESAEIPKEDFSADESTEESVEQEKESVISAQ